jgi:hypothetical protein
MQQGAGAKASWATAATYFGARWGGHGDLPSPCFINWTTGNSLDPLGIGAGDKIGEALIRLNCLSPFHPISRHLKTCLCSTRASRSTHCRHVMIRRLDSSWFPLLWRQGLLGKPPLAWTNCWSVTGKSIVFATWYSAAGTCKDTWYSANRKIQKNTEICDSQGWIYTLMHIDAKLFLGHSIYYINIYIYTQMLYICTMLASD